MDSNQVSNWNKDAFARNDPKVSSPTVRLFSCNAATAKENSLAYKLADNADVTVFAYAGKTSYDGIITERSPWTKIKDKLLGQTYPEADRYWSDLKKGILNPSINGPKAGDGAKLAEISPDGKISWNPISSIFKPKKRVSNSLHLASSQETNVKKTVNKRSARTVKKVFARTIKKGSAGKVFERCFR